MNGMWELVRGAIALDADVFRQMNRLPQAEWIALYVVLLAGLSESIGQGIVLFVNRVTPVRFILSMGIAVLLFVLGFLAWALSTWIASLILFKQTISPVDLFQTLGLAFAPRLLTVFVALPYFGVPLTVILSIWSFLAFLVGLHVALSLSLWQAFWCSIVGWLVFQILEFAIGRPVSAIGRWLRNSVAGVPLVTNLRDLEQLIYQGRH